MRFHTDGPRAFHVAGAIVEEQRAVRLAGERVKADAIDFGAGFDHAVVTGPDLHIEVVDPVERCAHLFEQVAGNIGENRGTNAVLANFAYQLQSRRIGTNPHAIFKFDNLGNVLGSEYDSCRTGEVLPVLVAIGAAAVVFIARVGINLEEWRLGNADQRCEFLQLCWSRRVAEHAPVVEDDGIPWSFGHSFHSDIGVESEAVT